MLRKRDPDRSQYKVLVQLPRSVLDEEVRKVTVILSRNTGKDFGVAIDYRYDEL